MAGKLKINHSDIMKQIRDYLNIRNIFHWKVMQGLGCAKGVSDILGIYKTKPLAIEVKTARGKVTEAQQGFIDRFKAEGGIAFVARSIEDVIAHLEEIDRETKGIKLHPD